jgi:hypothetical protein
MSTLEALHSILHDQEAPEIIRNHITDVIQYALRNRGGYVTDKELKWFAEWDDTRIPIAANKLLSSAAVPKE